MSKKALITSRDSQGRHVVGLFEAVLNETGFRSNEAQYIIEHGDRFKAEQRKFLERFAIACPAAREAAQKLLGTNFFGVEDWQENYGLSLTKSQLAKVSEFPWSEKVLTAPCPFHSGKQVKDTHFAFLGLEQSKKQPLTIGQWQKLHPASNQPRFYSYPPDCWYKNEPFANEVSCQLRWYLCLKEIVPGSENKTFDGQQAMLPPEYEVPSAVEEVTKCLACFKKTGIYLNPNRYGRVRDTSSGGGRVHVGLFGAGGLFVYSDWAGSRWGGVGLAASRKLGA